MRSTMDEAIPIETHCGGDSDRDTVFEASDRDTLLGATPIVTPFGGDSVRNTYDASCGAESLDAAVSAHFVTFLCSAMPSKTQIL